MILIYPYSDVDTSIFSSTFVFNKIEFLGMRTMAKGFDKSDSSEIWIDMPIAHGIPYPYSYHQTQGVVPSPQSNWYGKLLKKTFEEPFSEVVITPTLLPKKRNKLLVLNCLDVYYGHSILKLLNLQYYQDNYPEMDILVIVPSFLKWMIPSTLSCIDVNVKLRDGYRRISQLDEIVKKCFDPYLSVFLSKAYNHPHPLNYNLAKLINSEAFDINQLNNTTAPVVTFIWREDRVVSKYDKLFYYSLMLKKHFKIPFFHYLFIAHQKKTVQKLAHAFHEQYPFGKFVITGTDSTFKFHPSIVDKRSSKPNQTIEREWCDIYSKSHLVVGIHGSNMLIPSGLAGMVLELLPNDRLGNYLQDLLFHSSDDVRLSLFRYRLIPMSSSCQVIQMTILSMIGNYSDFQSNMKRIDKAGK